MATHYINSVRDLPSAVEAGLIKTIIIQHDNNDDTIVHVIPFSSYKCNHYSFTVPNYFEDSGVLGIMQTLFHKGDFDTIFTHKNSLSVHIYYRRKLEKLFSKVLKYMPEFLFLVFLLIAYIYALK